MSVHVTEGDFYEMARLLKKLNNSNGAFTGTVKFSSHTEEFFSVSVEYDEDLGEHVAHAVSSTN